MPQLRSTRTRRPLATSIAFATLLCLATVSASAQTETVLYNFQPANDVITPLSSLVADHEGNLYGTGSEGAGLCPGPTTCVGGVFRLSPPTTAGGSWTETVLYSFGSHPNDGQYPAAGLIFDQQGNLYGTTASGGAATWGTVFELSPPSTAGGPWTESILYNFTGGTSDGAVPLASLVFDKQGNLYGTTKSGGSGECYGFPGSCGTIFQLSPPSTKGGVWRHRIIHNFGFGADGSYPTAPLIVGEGGALLGTTSGGGFYNCPMDGLDEGCGVVFQLTPPATAGAAWTEELYRIPSQLAAAFAYGGVVQGHNGRLYAATSNGGTGQQCLDGNEIPVGCGVIFELALPTPGNHTWHVIPIYNFTGLADGAFPLTALVLDKSGNLYGTAAAGGGLGACSGAVLSYAQGCGTVFRLTPPASSGGAWTETTLHAFTGRSDGALPRGTLILNGGAIYGTTFYGGYNNGFNGLGTIFKVIP
jgi:uncharacterized repeat protein (TIGR03803 family)